MEPVRPSPPAALSILWIAALCYVLLLVSARLNDERADVSRVLFETLSVVVNYLVEDTDPRRAFFIYCHQIAEVENILCQVVSGRRVRVPPWLVDGQNVVLVYPGWGSRTSIPINIRIP